MWSTSSVIPSTWTPHYRDDDGELIGYLQPASAELVIPVTVFGYPLDEACEERAADQVLEQHGLSYLADRWKLRVPGGTIEVVISEASPDRLVLANADFHHVVGAPIGHKYVLGVPDEIDRITR